MATGYLLTLSLSVEDDAALWQAAAALAMAAPGMTIDDVAETIGPREAPNVGDCLALLLEPERFAGCAIQSLDLFRPGASPAATRALAPAETAAVPGERQPPFSARRSLYPVGTLLPRPD